MNSLPFKQGSHMGEHVAQWVLLIESGMGQLYQVLLGLRGLIGQQGA